MVFIVYLPPMAQMVDSFLLAKEYFWDRKQLLRNPDEVSQRFYEVHSDMLGDDFRGARRLFSNRKAAVLKKFNPREVQEMFPGLLDENLNHTFSTYKESTQQLIGKQLAMIRQKHEEDSDIFLFGRCLDNLHQSLFSQSFDAINLEEISKEGRKHFATKLLGLQHRASLMIKSHVVTLIASVALIVFGITGTYLGGFILGLSGFCLVGRVVSLSYYSRMQERFVALQR